MGLFDIFKRTTTEIKSDVEIKQPKSEDELIEELTTAILKRSFLDKFGNTTFEVLESENIFFKELVKQVVAEKLQPRYLHFNLMSIKDYYVYYATYPIGRIKLRGRKTHMQVLKGTFGIKHYENLTLEEYMSYIPDWIRRIKYCLRN